MANAEIREHIRFSPDILVRLGEELIPSPEQGILELVKNSYDAEASRCTIELKSDSTGVCEAIIIDNGNGMDLDAIRSGWLVLGRSSKVIVRSRGGRFSRFQVGDKGLGRLSALRQGKMVSLITRPKNEPGIQYSLIIDWDKFDSVDVVEDVDLDIKKGETSEGSGTEIYIHDLKNRFSKNQVEKLARDLLLLSDPFDTQFGFTINLIAPEYSNLEKLVKNGYFEDAEYHLVAMLNNGMASARVLDWKGDILYEADHQKLSNKSFYSAPNIKFELWAFLLGKKAFSAGKSPTDAIKTWLSFVGGVHIYHRGVRIKPYGDISNDWLDMNLRRSRSPEERPSTNNSFGIVFVDDPLDNLIAKTDRVGFVENDSFLELRRFCQDSLDWMAKERLKVAEKRRRQEREKKPKNVVNARKHLDEVISSNVPTETIPSVAKALELYQKAFENEVGSLREDLQMYRSLATAGAMIVKFAHQTGKPISTITRLCAYFDNKGAELLGEKFPGSTFEKSVQLLKTVAETIGHYSIVPISILKREKRRNGVVFVHDTIINSEQILSPFLTQAHINVQNIFFDGDICIRGSTALLESVITNFITNSITALTEGENAPTTDRKIVFKTNFDEGMLTIKAIDNGPGILVDTEEIWLPGRTTTIDGTGFGLTIVKDSVSDLGGYVSALPHSEYGGAEFTVVLPAFINVQGRLL